MSTANPAGVLPFSVIWDMVRQRRIGRRIHSCGMAMSMVITLSAQMSGTDAWR
ncbi:MAG: hypothetical protein JRF35_07475 [Deltaproteobacteria bacterium]|nr:hypothetical protein [Deltaproteobacteria bacterium]